MTLLEPGIGQARGVPTARQSALLDAFRALIVREGFRHLTVGEIASRLECSRRTLYELAPSKDDLVALAVEQFLDEFLTRCLAEIDRHKKPGRQLEAAAATVVSEFSSLTEAFTRDAVSTPRTAALLGRFTQQFAEGLAVVIEEGIRKGEFRRVNPRLVAEAILGIVNRLQQPGVLAGVGLDYADAARQVSVVFLDGLRAR